MKGLAEGGEAELLILEDIKACEARIAALKAQIVPLRQTSGCDLLRTWNAWIGRSKGAQVAVRDSGNREKAEALGKVLDRVTCALPAQP